MRGHIISVRLAQSVYGSQLKALVQQAEVDVIGDAHESYCSAINLRKSAYTDVRLGQSEDEG